MVIFHSYVNVSQRVFIGFQPSVRWCLIGAFDIGHQLLWQGAAVARIYIYIIYYYKISRDYVYNLYLFMYIYINMFIFRVYIYIHSTVLVEARMWCECKYVGTICKYV
jgi:hypothetical protein